MRSAIFFVALAWLASSAVAFVAPRGVLGTRVTPGRQAVAVAAKKKPQQFT